MLGFLLFTEGNIPPDMSCLSLQILLPLPRGENLPIWANGGKGQDKGIDFKYEIFLSVLYSCLFSASAAMWPRPLCRSGVPFFSPGWIPWLALLVPRPPASSDVSLHHAFSFCLDYPTSPFLWLFAQSTHTDFSPSN